MTFNLLLLVSPILAVAIGGLLLMLAEAFGKPVALTGAQAGMVSTDAGAGRADELALGSAVVLFAGALISVALWKVGPESIPGVESLAPYLIIDRFSLFFCSSLTGPSSHLPTPRSSPHDDLGFASMRREDPTLRSDTSRGPRSTRAW